MFLQFFIFVILAFVGGFCDKIDGDDNGNLYNHAIDMKHVIASVGYKDQQITVWKDKSHNRFYAFPICVVEMDTLRCEENQFLNPSRHGLLFTVRLWDDEIREEVYSALLNLGNNLTVEKTNIQMLPMQEVRLQAKTGNIEVDKNWRSFLNQPYDMEFEIFVKDSNFCKTMLNRSLESPQSFFTQTQLEFEFTMVAQQQSTREINITSDTLKKSELYTRLKNFYKNELNNSNEAGSIFMDSDDLKKLARELYNSASASEEISSDFPGSEEEDKLINAMIARLSEQKMDWKDLSEDDVKSVFWDKKFATPDKITHYLNNVFKYDEKDKLFHYDAQKDEEFRGDIFDQKTTSNEGSGSWGGGGSFFDILKVDSKMEGGGSKNDTSTTQNKTETIDKKAFSVDDIQNALDKSNINVEWEGEKFIPKSLDLYRVNLNDLSNKNDIFADKMYITPVKSNLSVPLKPDMDSLTLFPDKLPIKYDIQNLTNSPSEAMDDVEYQGRQIRIYRDDHRIVGSPLGLVEMESMKCKYNPFKSRLVLSFNVKLWDEKIEQLIADRQGKSKDGISIFPMIEVRLAIANESGIEANPQWIPYQNENPAIAFEVFVENQAQCKSFVDQAAQDPYNFFLWTELKLEYPIISTQMINKDFLVTFKIAETSLMPLTRNGKKAPFTADLILDFETSEDIARNIFRETLLGNNVQHSDISNAENHRIINQIKQKLYAENIFYDKLSATEKEEIIWSNSSANPNLQILWFNEVFQYKNATDQFFINIGNANHWQQNSLITMFNISFSCSDTCNLQFERYDPIIMDIKINNSTNPYMMREDIVKITNLNSVNVKWDGQEFIPKPVLELHRIEAQNFTEISFTAAVPTKVKHIQSIPLLPYLTE